MKVKSVKYSTGTVNLNKHNHDNHQILYVKSGIISVILGGKEEILTSGSLLILSRFEEHSVKVLSSEYSRYMLLVSSETSSTDKDNYLLTSVLVNRKKGFHNIINTGEHSNEFEEILSKMSNEYKDKSAFYEDQLNIMLHSLLISLYRLTPEIFTDDPKINISVVREIQERFESNFSETFTLSELATEYHISVSHLAHIFKSVTGYALMDYLIVCRLTAAKKYLSTTSMPIKEIVDICGFGDESNFSRMFKARIGMTPSAYRRLNTLT